MTDLFPFFCFLLPLDLLLRCIPSSKQVSEFGAKGFSCLGAVLTFYYSTLLQFTFCLLPFIGDLLVLPHCIDISVLNSPFDLLLWPLVRH
jgi:hypothetical protein